MKASKSQLFLLLLLIISQTIIHAKYILFASYPIQSHIFQQLEVAKSLQSNHGERVAISTFEEFSQLVFSSNITLVSLGQDENLSTDSPLYKQRIERLSRLQNPMRKFAIELSRFVEIYSSTFKGLKSELEKEKPDFMVIDLMNWAAIDLANQFNIPFAIFPASVGFMGFLQETYNPFLSWGFTKQEMDFFTRLYSTVFVPWELFFFFQPQMKLLKKARQQLGVDHSIDTMKNVGNHLVIVPSFIGWEHARQVPSNVKFVGAITTNEQP